jgi:hypothetical protein
MLQALSPAHGPPDAIAKITLPMMQSRRTS